MRTWFNSTIQYHNLEVDKEVDELFRLMKLGFLKYFNIQEVESFDKLIKQAKQNNILEQQRFIKWIEDEGYEKIDNYLQSELPNNQDYIHEVKYITFILNEEIIHYNSKESSDMRGLLMTIIIEYLETNMNTKI